MSRDRETLCLYQPTFNRVYFTVNDWSEIEKRYGPIVWSTAYRILRNYDDASDCYQDVFVELYEKSKAQHFEVKSALFKWLATRRAIDQLRKKSVAEAKIRDMAVLTKPKTADAPGREIEGTEIVEIVRASLAELPSKQAEVFWLRCVEELTYEEIAKHVGASANQVGVLFHRSKSKLRRILSTTLSR